MIVSENIDPRFADVLLKLTHIAILLKIEAPAKVESNPEVFY